MSIWDKLFRGGLTKDQLAHSERVKELIKNVDTTVRRRNGKVDLYSGGFPDQGGLYCATLHQNGRIDDDGPFEE